MVQMCKALGAPVYQLLGGKVNERIKLYTHTHFLSQTPDEFATSAAEAVALGYEAVTDTANLRLTTPAPA